MKLNPISASLLTIILSACTSLQPTISKEYRDQLMTLAPGIGKYEAVDKVYSDLSTAPVEVVAGLSPQVREVWTLKGCPDGKRMRVELLVFGNNNGTLSSSEY